MEAFHSTLDEIREADLILLVADTAARQRDAQIASVREVLSQIGAGSIPTCVVYNKIDLVQQPGEIQRLAELDGDAVFVSAKTGEGISGLVDMLEKHVQMANVEMTVLVPYGQGHIVQQAHEHATVLSEDYEEQGTRIALRVPKAYKSMFEAYRADGANPA